MLFVACGVLCVVWCCLRFDVFVVVCCLLCDGCCLVFAVCCLMAVAVC